MEVLDGAYYAAGGRAAEPGPYRLKLPMMQCAGRSGNRLARKRAADTRATALLNPYIATAFGFVVATVAQQRLRSILAFHNSPLMNAVESCIESGLGSPAAMSGHRWRRVTPW